MVTRLTYILPSEGYLRSGRVIPKRTITAKLPQIYIWCTWLTFSETNYVESLYILLGKDHWDIFDNLIVLILFTRLSTSISWKIPRYFTKRAYSTETNLQIESRLHSKMGPIRHWQFELLMPDWSKLSAV